MVQPHQKKSLSRPPVVVNKRSASPANVPETTKEMVRPYH